MYEMEFAKIKKAADEYQRGLNIIEDINKKLETLNAFSNERTPLILNFVGNSARIDFTKEASDKVYKAVREILEAGISDVWRVMNQLECPAGTVSGKKAGE